MSTADVINLVSDEDSSSDDNFIGQSKNAKRHATATGQRKGAVTSTENEQRKCSMVLLKAKLVEIKQLEAVLEKRGELIIRPENPEFDFFFIDYHDDDISEVLERKDRLIKILKFRAYGTY